jgi:predicted lipoprotein with Yx(FWY)xxD motif
MSVSRARSLSLAAIFAAALLAGCGSGSKTTTTTTTTTSSQSVTSSAQSSYAPAASTSGAGAAVVVTSKQNKLGTILGAGPKRLTVYLFEGDKGASSSCSGPCAVVWPPVTTTGKPQASGGALAAELGTITRSDGTTQVTYKGHPLYYFAKDGDAGDAYGQGIKGFGAGWYVLSPSDSKIDNS